MSEIDFCADPKRSVLQFARAVGLFRLGLAAQKRSHPLLVLCYHGISKSDEHEWNPELYMPPELFRQRLRTIQRLGYRVRPLAQAVEEAHSDSLDHPTIALTFDDGWHDFYNLAWPILREFDFPATVYQTTYYSNFNRPIFDTASSYLLWKGRGRMLADSQLTGSKVPVRLSSAEVINKIDQDLKARTKDLRYSAPEQDRMLIRLAAALDLDYGELLRSRKLHLMNSSEIAEVSRAGIDVQLHTHTHWIPVEKERFFREIERNRFFIEMATGKPAVHFCYPNGRHRPELAEWLREAGVQTATTCDPGSVTRTSKLMYLPRLTDSCRVSQVRFESWLAGIGLIGCFCKRTFSKRQKHPESEGPHRGSKASPTYEFPAVVSKPTNSRSGEQQAARAAGGRR